MLCTALTNMNMCPILMIVSVPEQEIPDDFSRDVKKYLWHIAIDYRLQIYNFYVRNGLFALTFLLFMRKVQPKQAIFFNEMLNNSLRSKIFTK